MYVYIYICIYIARIIYKEAKVSTTTKCVTLLNVGCIYYIYQ